MASDTVTIIHDGFSPPTGSVTDDKVAAGANIARNKLAQDTEAVYGISLTDVRVHDAPASFLPTAATGDDLGLTAGTFGTDYPTLQTEDAKATTKTQRGRFTFTLPAEYDADETIRVQVKGGMITTISDGTAEVDVEVYKADDAGDVGSDLCATNATTINTLVSGGVTTVNFDVTDTGLSAGDQLDVRVTVSITDSATGTAVIGEITKLAMLLDVRG